MPGSGPGHRRGRARRLPDAQIAVVPVADGGEGTVRALVAATAGESRRRRVDSPLGEPVEAEWGMLGTGREHDARNIHARTAVIEMAAASGLPLVSPSRRDPRITTTRGTGELLRAALDCGLPRGHSGHRRQRDQRRRRGHGAGIGRAAAG